MVIADVQEEKGRELAQDIGPDAVFAFADVCREADVLGMIETAAAEFGGLDCLFNNAGFGGVTGDIETTDMGEPYERTVGAMLTGVVLGMKHAAPHLKARGGGAIISTASVAGIRGGWAPMSIRGEGGGGQPEPFGGHGIGPFSIRVNAICPGGIATPIFAGQLAQSGGNEDYAAAVRPFSSKCSPCPVPGARRHRQCGLLSGQRRGVLHHWPGPGGGWRPDGRQLGAPGRNLGLGCHGRGLRRDDAADMDMVVHDPAMDKIVKSGRSVESNSLTD